MKENLYILSTITVKNIKLKYKNSVLGFFWSLLTPMVYLGVFTFIFSQAFPNIENYPLFAITALIFWTYFSNSSTQIVNSIISSSGILKSVNVPSITFPLTALFAAILISSPEVSFLAWFLPVSLVTILATKYKSNDQHEKKINEKDSEL